MGRRDDWVDIFQALGEAFIEVLRSEWDVLWRTWRASFRHVLFAALCFVLAGCFLFMAVALLVTAAVQIVALWFEPWKATLIVAAGVVLVVSALAAVGYFVYLRRFENPIRTGQERLADHLEWWRERLLRGERVLPEGVDHDESSDETSGAGSRASE